MHINVAHFIRCHPSIRWWKIIFLLSLTLFALSLFRKCVTILHCKRAKKIFLLYLVGFAFCVLAREISATRAISYASKAQSNLLNRLFVKDGIEKNMDFLTGIEKNMDFLTTRFPYSICQQRNVPTAKQTYRHTCVSLFLLIFQKWEKNCLHSTHAFRLNEPEHENDSNLSAHILHTILCAKKYT